MHASAPDEPPRHSHGPVDAAQPDSPYFAIMKHNKHSNIIQSPKTNGVPLLSAAEKPTRDEARFVESRDEVARRAYFTYLNEGSPEGRDVQHWLDAEAQLLKERQLTRTHGFHIQSHLN